MSKIQKFSTFVEASAADLSAKTPKNDEKELKPRSKGEQDFVDAHVTETEPHPTADDEVLTGSTKPTTPKGKDAGEKKPIKPIKEEAEDEDEDESEEDEDDEDLEEGVMDTLRKIVKDKQMQKVKFANGKTMRIDLTTASAMVNAHDKRIKNDATKAKFADAVEKDPNSFMKMMDIALGGK